MAINAGDIQLVTTQVMADVPEGGGAPTATAIVDGNSNSVFSDISELDRSGGRVNLRKVAAVVKTPNVEGYYGANVIVAEPFDDPRVSVSLFAASSNFDTRREAVARLESYLTKGAEWQGFLYENHIAGQRVIQLFQRTGTPLPSNGQTLVLVENEGLGNEKTQYVRVTSVTGERRTFTTTVGGSLTDYEAQIVTCEISDPLRYDFTGSPASRLFSRTSDGSAAAPNRTRVRDTVVADAGSYAGVTPLAQAASLGALTLRAESVYTQLVPSAQTETPIADANPLQQTVGYVASGGQIAQSLTLVFTTAQSLFIGGSILPGSLSITRGGITLTDAGGSLFNGGTEVGQVDYENGVVALSANVFGTNGGTHAITYTPAAVPRTFGPSLSLDVTAQTRSLSYVRTLESVPAAGTLVVSFQVGRRWYVLRDNGTGQLRGAASTDGAGTVNYTTGTVSVTLGALPDVGSIVLFQWAPSLALSKLQAAELTQNARLFAELEFPNAPVGGALTLAWNDGSARTATVDAGGTISGAATGTLVGTRLLFSPNTLPPAGTVVTASYSANQSQSTVVTSLPGTDQGSTWEYAIPAFGATNRALTVRVSVEYQNERVAGVFTSSRGARPVTLFTIGDNGTDLWASFTFGVGSASIIVGSVNWGTGKFRVNKTFSANAQFHEYTTVNGSLVEHWPFGSVEHRVNPSGLLYLSSPVWQRGGTVLTGQSTPFTLSAFQARPDALVGSALSAQAIAFSVGSAFYRQGTTPGTTTTLYGSIDPTNGTGTAVGTVAADGTVSLTTWTAGSTSAISDWSAVWAPPTPGVNVPLYFSKATFRTALAPLRPSSVTVSAKTIGGTTLTGTTDATGVLSGGITGTVDFENGIVKLSGVQTLDAASLTYNGVGVSYLPLSAALLGLDPVRLPTDGRVPIFRPGSFAVVGHTATVGPANVSNGQTIDCARVRLSRVRVIGNNGQVINTGYTADLDAGTVTFTSVAGYSQPVRIEHRIEDMLLVRDVQINGDITFTSPVSHAYPVGSYISSAIVQGDIAARVESMHDLATWAAVWNDTANGAAAANATFNSVQAPIVVTNAGALTERWAVRFTSSASFEVIGEHVGVIAIGNTGADCSPMNPAASLPYFTIPAAGWGLGWAQGNVLRFNTVGAVIPLWVVRTIQQGPETVQNDSFTLLVRGDVDRP